MRTSTSFEHIIEHLHGSSGRVCAGSVHLELEEETAYTELDAHYVSDCRLQTQYSYFNTVRVLLQ